MALRQGRRAAPRVPSRVSQLVRQLERRVGAALFERTTRQVKPTAIGQRLASDLRRAYAGLLGALTTAQAAAQGLEGKIRIGYLTHCDDENFGRLLASFRSAFPSCEVTTLDITGTDYFFIRIASEAAAPANPGYGEWPGPRVLGAPAD